MATGMHRRRKFRPPHILGAELTFKGTTSNIAPTTTGGWNVLCIKQGDTSIRYAEGDMNIDQYNMTLAKSGDSPLQASAVIGVVSSMLAAVTVIGTLAERPWMGRRQWDF
jgi:hypothetical protein